MLQIHCLESQTKEINNIFSRFAIGPLKKGQGITIGNALRRVLLSDLEGLSFSGVRIANINHEFSVVPNIKEDVIDILLNIKQIILKGSITESVCCRLLYTGPGIITAKEIALPTEIEFVEPNQYIATVTATSTIEMEFLIKKGEGYSLKQSNDLPKGFLAIDAIYMPVKKANFFIETSEDNILSNAETLILEISTNGSIKPIDALNYASDILQNIFDSLRILDLPKKITSFPIENLVPKTNNLNAEFDNILIEELELSVRAYNCLKRANINSLGELLKYSQKDLLGFKYFGQKSADEVCFRLKAKFGKSLN